jgi:mRNA-degrading endonuclease RelE of RelBE toxin-antitoxin system
MYRIAFTPEAVGDLDQLRKFDARRIIAGIELQLTETPALPTRNRKRLRPNKLAEWELRIENFRVFYDVIESEVVVRIVTVGSKVGNELFIRGERYVL